MKSPSMWARAWRPAVCDESPKRDGGKGDREGFEGGTHAEPGHRQRVRILTLDGTLVSRGQDFVDHVQLSHWETAIYDRVSCSFWVKLVAGWCQVTRDILAWTQYPLSADFVDPKVA